MRPQRVVSASWLDLLALTEEPLLHLAKSWNVFTKNLQVLSTQNGQNTSKLCYKYGDLDLFCQWNSFFLWFHQSFILKGSPWKLAGSFLSLPTAGTSTSHTVDSLTVIRMKSSKNTKLAEKPTSKQITKNMSLSPYDKKNGGSISKKLTGCVAMVCKTRFTSSQPQKIQQFVVRDLRWPSPPTTYRGFQPSVRNVSSVMGRGTGSGQVRRNFSSHNTSLKKQHVEKTPNLTPAQSESEFLRISSYWKARRIPKSWYNSAPRFVLPLQSSWFQTLCLEHLLLSKLGAWGFPCPHLKRCETSCIHRKPCWKRFGKSHLASHVSMISMSSWFWIDLVSLSSISLSNRWFASSS